MDQSNINWKDKNEAIFKCLNCSYELCYYYKTICYSAFKYKDFIIQMHENDYLMLFNHLGNYIIPGRKDITTPDIKIQDKIKYQLFNNEPITYLDNLKEVLIFL